MFGFYGVLTLTIITASLAGIAAGIFGHDPVIASPKNPSDQVYADGIRLYPVWKALLLSYSIIQTGYQVLFARIKWLVPTEIWARLIEVLAVGVASAIATFIWAFACYAAVEQVRIARQQM